MLHLTHTISRSPSKASQIVIGTLFLAVSYAPTNALAQACATVTGGQIVSCTVSSGNALTITGGTGNNGVNGSFDSTLSAVNGTPGPVGATATLSGGLTNATTISGITLRGGTGGTGGTGGFNGDGGAGGGGGGGSGGLAQLTGGINNSGTIQGTNGIVLTGGNGGNGGVGAGNTGSGGSPSGGVGGGGSGGQGNNYNNGSAGSAGSGSAGGNGGDGNMSASDPGANGGSAGNNGSDISSSGNDGGGGGGGGGGLIGAAGARGGSSYFARGGGGGGGGGGLAKLDNITNSGTIQGNNGVGILVESGGSITGSITNSGSIEGTTAAIQTTGSGSINHIAIAGNNTAKFIGKVNTPNTPVTVQAGAAYTMLNGQNFAVQSFTNNGTLTVASNATITGTFANSASGTFYPAITRAGYGQLRVNGSATLAGQLMVDAAGFTEWASNTLTDVIKTTGGLSGQFASATDNSLLFDFVPEYASDGKTLNLKITTPSSSGTSHTTNGPFSLAVNATGTAGCSRAAQVLDSLYPNTNHPVTRAFVHLSSQPGVSNNTLINNAVLQTLPLFSDSVAQASSAALDNIGDVIRVRQSDYSERTSAQTLYRDKRVWLSPFGFWGRQNQTNCGQSYTAQTSGMVLGTDTTASENLRLGLAFGWSQTQLTGQSSVAPKKADVNVYQLLGYGSYTLRADTTLHFRAGLGINNNRGDRQLPLFRTGAQADYNSTTATLSLDLARNYLLASDTVFTPSIRADYTLIKDKAYTETGAGALGLIVQGRSSASLVLGINGQFVKTFQPGRALTAHLGLGYDTMNQRAAIISAYKGAPNQPFSTASIEPNPWIVQAGVGFTQMFKKGMELSLRYELNWRQRRRIQK